MFAELEREKAARVQFRLWGQTAEGAAELMRLETKRMQFSYSNWVYLFTKYSYYTSFFRLQKSSHLQHCLEEASSGT
jgi:hypothetical protein